MDNQPIPKKAVSKIVTKGAKYADTNLSGGTAFINSPTKKTKQDSFVGGSPRMNPGYGGVKSQTIKRK